MCKSKAKLSVLFEEPFWIGLYERWTDGRYAVCRTVFGSEPKDYDVYAFLLENWSRLRFSPSVDAAEVEEKHGNPKRMQRGVKKQLEHTGIGTKAQQALNRQREQSRETRKTVAKALRTAEEERRYALRQQKHKEKHKGH